jgi:transcriptional regulator with XRE-family HTH domain
MKKPKQRVPVRSISPAVHQLFALIEDSGMTLKELALKAGSNEARAYRIHRGLYDYRVGVNIPNVATLEEILGAIGYEIKFVKKNYETEQRTRPDSPSDRSHSAALPF